MESNFLGNPGQGSTALWERGKGGTAWGEIRGTNWRVPHTRSAWLKAQLEEPSPPSMGLRSPQPHGGVRQFCCSEPVPRNTSACCVPAPGPCTPHCGARHSLQSCSVSWATSRDLGQDTADGAGRLLLPQQELGEGKAAGPGCSQVSPSIL